MEQNGTAFTIQGNFIDAAKREREDTAHDKTNNNNTQ
jgi:hypothetical protein